MIIFPNMWMTVGEEAAVWNIGGGEKKQSVCVGVSLGSSLQSVEEEEEEFLAIFKHILGKSLLDACFDHCHFPSVHCVSAQMLHADRQWLVNLSFYTNVLLSSADGLFTVYQATSGPVWWRIQRV